MIEYHELEQLLQQFDIVMGTSETHGFLSGYLCVSDSLQDEIIIEYFLTNTESTTTRVEECVLAFSSLAETIRQQLADQEFSFQMLLVDEDSPIFARCDSLAEWCQGYLSGLGVVGQTNWQALSAQCHDIIADFYKICRLSGDDDQDPEDAAASIMELEEYVRMGVLYLYDEFTQISQDQEIAEVLH